MLFISLPAFATFQLPKKKKQKSETYFRFWIACQGSYGATNPAKKKRPQHSLHKAADILWICTYIFCIPYFSLYCTRDFLYNFIYIYTFISLRPQLCHALECRAGQVPQLVEFFYLGIIGIVALPLWCCKSEGKKKIEKFNNWVNGTNTLFIFSFCCCWFYYFVVILLNKSPCHVSAGKTTPTWRKNQGPGPRKFSLACALLGCPPKNIYHVQIFHVFCPNMTTNIKFHVLSGATEKVTE